MLTLPQKILTELSSSTYSLTPLILISAVDPNFTDPEGNDVYLSTDSSEAIILLSTVKQTLIADNIKAYSGGFNVELFSWEDRNLALGGIKESIDFENKNFKINNVQLSLSNKPVNGTAFSDLISERPILNKEISIFYQTPSCKKLSDAILVYKGIITSVSHNFKDVKIECEDKTQYKLEKKFPIANIGFGNHIVNDEHTNKPIPIVYGLVDRCPTILRKESSLDTVEEFNTYVLCDDVLNDERNINIGGFGGDIKQASAFLSGINLSCPLFMHKGAYVQITQKLTEFILQSEFDEIEDFGSWTNPIQYVIENNNYISIPSAYEIGLSPSTPPAFGDLQGFIIRHPQDILIVPSDTSVSGLWQNITEDLGVTVLNKHYAIDGESLEKSPYTTLNFDSSNSPNTYATIPDQSIDIFENVTDWYLKTGINPVRFNNSRYLGMWLPKWDSTNQWNTGWDNVDSDRLTTGQFQIFQYLMLYCCEINAGWNPASGEEPPLEIIYLPTKEAVWELTRQRIIRDFYYKDDIGTPFEEDEIVSGNTSMTIWYRGTQTGFNIQEDGYYPIDSQVLASERWIPDVMQSSVGGFHFSHLGQSGAEGNEYAPQNEHFFAPMMNAYPYICSSAFQDYKNALGGTISLSDGSGASDLGIDTIFGVDGKKYWGYQDGEGGESANPMLTQGVFFRFQIAENHWKLVHSTGSLATEYGNASGGLIHSFDNGANMFVTVGDVNESINDVSEAGRADAWISSQNGGSHLLKRVGHSLAHYNMFSTEGYTPIANKNDCPSIVPTERTSIARFNNSSSEADFYRHDWGADITFTGYKNLAHLDDIPYYSSLNIAFSDGISYFKRWGQGSFIGIATEDMFTNSDYHDYNHGYPESMEDEYGWGRALTPLYPTDFLNVGGTGEGNQGTQGCFRLNQSFQIQTENNRPSFLEDFQVSGELKYQDCVVPKYTTLPLAHLGNSAIDILSTGSEQHGTEGTLVSWYSSGYMSKMTSFGEVYNYSPEYVSVSTTITDSPPSQRLGLMFPVKTIDLEDTILTKTLFSGKIAVTVREEGTEGTDYQNFLVALNKMEYNDGSGDEKDFHEDMNLFHDKLISKELTAAPFTRSWSVYGEGNVDGGYNQWLINPDDPEWISDRVDFDYAGQQDISSAGWNAVNDYNAFCLQYFVDNNDGDGTCQASFNTKVYEANLVHFCHFNPIFDSEFYVDVTGRINNSDDIIPGNVDIFKYTGKEASTDLQDIIIDKPSDIIFHLLEKEFGLLDLMDYESISAARIVHISDKFAFSITEEKSGKQFLKDFASSTKIFPTFKSTSKFGFVSVKEIYEASDIDMTINIRDIITSSFSRTSLDEIKTLVNVKYNIDYASGDYTRETGYVDGYDMFGNGDGIDGAGINSSGRVGGYKYSYLGIERDNNVLEFESEFIRDQQTAVNLRDFIYLNSCNQHNIFKLKLPLKYFSLEVGDIITFSALINGMKAYGEDYTKPIVRNGQTIYPYFIITSINKKRKDIEIICYQTHKLVKSYNLLLGCVTRLFDTNDDNVSLSITESLMIQEFIDGNDRYFTSGQKLSCDFDGDGIITDDDLYSAEIVSYTPILGDVNEDGVINIVDLVALISFVLGESGQEEIDMGIADINGDGLINVVDVVAMVNFILTEEGNT